MWCFKEWLSQRNEAIYNEIFEKEKKDNSSFATKDLIEIDDDPRNEFDSAYLTQVGKQLLGYPGKNFSEKIDILARQVGKKCFSLLQKDVSGTEKPVSLKELELGIRKIMQGGDTNRGINLFRKVVMRMANQYGCVAKEEYGGVTIMSAARAKELAKKGELSSTGLRSSAIDKLDKQAGLYQRRAAQKRAAAVNLPPASKSGFGSSRLTSG